MDTTIIAQSLNNWKDIATQGDKLVDFLSQGNCFFYNRPDNTKTDGQIHAYPAIYDSRLVFLVIPAEYDNQQYKEQLSKYVEVCPLVFVSPNGSNRIPDGVAKERVENWDKHYNSWVPKQSATTTGIFMAFTIAVEDFEVKETIVNLALMANGEQDIPFTADVVISNKEANKVYYDDFAKSVPPYSLTATANSFYLLTL
jgi:hypothetical protein